MKNVIKDKVRINPFYRFLIKRYIYSKLDSHGLCSGDIRSTYHQDHNLQLRKTFQPLVKKINKTSKNFFDANLIITAMWSNVGDYNSKVIRHNHIDNDISTDLFKQRGISGVFYLKKPKNSGNFITDGGIIEVSEGDVLFFSPHLFHQTEKNKSRRKRIAISFNGYLL